MQLVSIPLQDLNRLRNASSLSFFYPDYPRTLREWGRRLEANLTQDHLAKDYPALQDRANYETFKRKWHYLFAYAGAGFAKGYITCHMITFIRPVSNPCNRKTHPTSDLHSLQNDSPERCD